MLGSRFLYIDLRAAKPVEDVVILVEIKSFEHPSPIEALAAAIGKYTLYQGALALAAITSSLYLALPEVAFTGIISEPIGEWLITQHHVRLIVVDTEREEIVRWIT